MASASTWVIHLSGGAAEAKAQTSPSAPTGPSATCTSANLTTIRVSWTAVTHATNYSVYESTTSSSSGYALATTTASTSWTTPSLSNANYWFEVAASVGTNWASAKSSATVQRTITTGHCA
jgi:fibronectin type 3 domain-containing protein